MEPEELFKVCFYDQRRTTFLSSLKLLVRDLLMIFRMMMEMRQMLLKRSNFVFFSLFDGFLFRKICLYKIEDDSINLVAEDSLKQEMLETDVRTKHKN